MNSTSSRALYKIPGDDVSFNRFQDQILGTLNAFMKRMQDQVFVLPVYTSASLPTADGTSWGMIVRVKDPLSREEVRVCVTTSNGTYEWVLVAQASS